MKGVLAVSLFLTSVAWADGPEQHKGFYLRLHIGPAYFSATADTPEIHVKGNGGTFGIAIGGAVTENLIIYGEAYDDIAIDPTIETDFASVEMDGNSGIVGYGGGLVYYFMPVNIYVAGAVDATTIVVSGVYGDERTDFGTGANFMLGKEWWASGDWGLGVAGQFAFAGGMKDDAGINYRAWAFGVAFSATYN